MQNNREWKSEYNELTKIAMEARKNSYSPYSEFAVGAALVAKNGNIYSGCNIENVTFGNANCAERTALFNAISQGEREFSLILIVANYYKSNTSVITTPCGICRQALREFVDPKEFLIIMPEVAENGTITKYQINTLDELLPDSFGPENLS